MDVVHVDEKWFDKLKVSRSIIMAQGEKVPKRSAKHKSHIEKVMFLCTQAHPQCDPAKKQNQSGVGS